MTFPSDLHIALLQFDPVWEEPDQNRDRIEHLLIGIRQETRLLILPEMFSTGFSMAPENVAESMDGPTLKWMKKIAGRLNAAICGSLIIRENNLFYNRFVFVHPSGEIRHYDKRHLFTMGEEPAHYEAGNKRIVVEFEGWRICPLICYDLRFPVWSRNKNNYDVLIYSANWPSSRQDVWSTLLKARAIENQCYVAGVNRAGTDLLQIYYSGGSQVVTPKGTYLAQSVSDCEELLFASLSYHELFDFRKKFPVLDDADDFIPPYL